MLLLSVSVKKHTTTKVVITACVRSFKQKYLVLTSGNAERLTPLAKLNNTILVIGEPSNQVDSRLLSSRADYSDDFPGHSDYSLTFPVKLTLSFPLIRFFELAQC